MSNDKNENKMFKKYLFVSIKFLKVLMIPIHTKNKTWRKYLCVYLVNHAQKSYFQSKVNGLFIQNQFSKKGWSKAVAACSKHQCSA